MNIRKPYYREFRRRFYETLGDKGDSILRYRGADNKEHYIASGNSPDVKPGGGMVETTWQELKDKRDAGKLIPGSLYRITDYQCTTTQENTRSAGHQFDIVLLALSEHKLAEEGWAMMHENIYDVKFSDGRKKCYIAKDSYYSEEDEGEVRNIVDLETGLGVRAYVEYLEIDEENKEAHYPFNIVCLSVEDLQHNYFQNSNLSAWKVWYCLDNDTSRFAWADATNGKGVIYRMIDEWGNDCPYDFKNIQFKRWKVTAANDELFVYSDENPHYFGIYDSNNDEIVAPYGINAEIEDIDDWRWCYTFDGYNTDKGEQYDFSTHRNKATDEAIHWAIEECNGGALQDVCSGNVIECYANADVGGDCTMQKMQLGNNVFFATSYCHYNEEDDYWEYGFADTWSNTLGQGASSNTLGDEASSNTLGQGAQRNTLGQGAQSNTLGQGAQSNTLGKQAESNTIGKDAWNNTLGQGAQNNTLGQGAQSNTLGQGAQSNTLGQDASRNTLGDVTSSNTLEQGANSNTLGEGAYRNTLDQGAFSNTLGKGANNNTLGKGAWSNTLGQNCHDIVFGSYVNNVAVSKAYCRYIRVEVGVEYVNITTNATTSISQYLQNIIVGMGVKGTSSNRKTITHATVNDAKQTTYVPTNSTTVNV